VNCSHSKVVQYLIYIQSKVSAINNTNADYYSQFVHCNVFVSFHFRDIVYCVLIVVIVCIHSVLCALYCLCSFVCCISFERGVLFCVMCVICVLDLIVVPLPPGKTHLQLK
jgi:hypothetical protein